MKRTRYTSGLSFYEEQTKVNMKLVREILIWVVLTVAAALLGVCFVIGFGFTAGVPDPSMSPVAEKGQYVMVSRAAYSFSGPEKGDVIAFYRGGNKDTDVYVKRVIALPGQTVQIVDGLLLVDGVPYSDDERYTLIKDPGIVDTPLLLGDDEYFVLNDVIDNGDDSRSAGIGAVREDDIIGKVWFALPFKGGHTGWVK